MSASAAACPPEFAAFAHRLAEASGAVVRPHFRTLAGVDTKADATPVTIADRDAETALRDLIRTHYPDHGVIGEEHGRERTDAEFVWILDPIDGTKSFVAGMPIFGTLIALVRNGQSILGVIDQPILRERWIGALGHPTLFNGAAVRASSRPLDQAVLFTTSLETFADQDEEVRFKRLARQVRIRRYCGDCYAYGLVASGHADLVVESELRPWDFAALVPVIEGAGGLVRDWSGRALAMQDNARVIAAANAGLLQAAVQAMTG